MTRGKNGSDRSPALHTGHAGVSVVDRVEVIKAVLTESVRPSLTAAHEAAYAGHGPWNGRFQLNKILRLKEG